MPPAAGYSALTVGEDGGQFVLGAVIGDSIDDGGGTFTPDLTVFNLCDGNTVGIEEGWGGV